MLINEIYLINNSSSAVTAGLNPRKILGLDGILSAVAVDTLWVDGGWLVSFCTRFSIARTKPTPVESSRSVGGRPDWC